MTSGTYQRFAAPEVATRDRFEYWRAWYSQAIDVPMQLEPVSRSACAFNASAEALEFGCVDLLAYQFGAADGSWTCEGIEPSGRLRLVILARSPGAHGSWHNHELSLTVGAAVLLGRTDGCWHAPEGLRGVQVNVPLDAIPVTAANLEQFNDQRRLRHDPVFASLVRPALLGAVGHLDTLADADLPELEGLWISLLTLLTRSLAERDLDGAETAQARSLQVQRYIRAHLNDPRLSPRTIADALHLSRSTLYAALRPDAGGIAGEIRRQRLRRAYAMLLDPTITQPIAAVAASVGIPNNAHFSRIFRDEYGLSPRQLRAREIERRTKHEPRPEAHSSS